MCGEQPQVLGLLNSSFKHHWEVLLANRIYIAGGVDPFSLRSACSVISLQRCTTFAYTSWYAKGGHIYEDHHHAKKHYKKHYKGHCPPGLAKKRNGCIPPGQAKKWRRGYPLARGVIYYDLSPRMVRQLGRPPTGHRYVRVAQDILLIAVGTGLVVDAVYDLNHM